MSKLVSAQNSIFGRPVYARLMCSSALVCAIVGGTSAAYGQAAPAPVETVVVSGTGTSIRGVQAVGTSLVTLDRDQLEQTGAQTISQMLATVPSVTGFGTGGNEFNSGGFDATGESLPTIHNLGASSSQSTLILVDGHPITPSSHDGYSDPSIIPSAALQRIDVLPDGDSAIYGSNAVAGVINFITRKDYEGFQTSLQYGAADSFNNFTFSQLWGHQWDTGGVFAVYEYKSSSHLLARDRDFSAKQDLRPRGGTNFNSYNCSPATIAATNAGSASVFAAPYTGSATATANNSQAATCDYKGGNTLIPSATVHTGFVSLTQSLTSWLSFHAQLGYSSRLNLNQAPQTTISATAFGPTGSSPAEGTAARNPFYQGNSATGTSSEFVRWDPTAMIGNSRNEVGARDAFMNTTWTADLGGDWQATLDTVTGFDYAFSHNTNRFCSACALLALNGSTNTNGSANTNTANTALADVSNLGTVVSVTRALNTGNALDVWNAPGSANKTSAAVIDSLGTDTSVEDDESDLNDVRLQFGGSLFPLPAGPLRVAFGGQYSQLHIVSRIISSNAAGPTSDSSRSLYAPMKRSVWAGFAEFYVPIINADMHVPLVQSLDMDIAGRYDQYSDVGSTKNPKVGLTWKVTDGLTARASYGTSFTAPNLDGLDPIAISTVGPDLTDTVNISPTNINYAGSFCNVTPTPCSPIVASVNNGVTIGAGNPKLKPSTGLSYSAGVDWDAGALFGLHGLTGTLTYWQVKIQGAVTRPPIQNEADIPALQPLLLLAPPGGWAPNDPAVLKALAPYPITSPLPNRIFFIYEGIRENAVNIQANGLDFNTQYAYDSGDYGVWIAALSGTETLRYDYAGAIGAPYSNFLNGHQNASVLHNLQFTGRFALTWNMDPFNVVFSTNFTNPYWYQNNNPPYNKLGLFPATGAAPGSTYEKVSSITTFDLNFGWDLPGDALGGWATGTKLTLDAHNILDTAPPFLDTPSGSFASTETGYDTWHGDPLGRIIKIGITKKW